MTLLDGPGDRRFLGYETFRELRIERGGLFSEADEVEALTANGQCLRLQSAFSGVELESFGRRRKHRLRDVSRLVVGTRTLRHSGGLAYRSPVAFRCGESGFSMR